MRTNAKSEADASNTRLPKLKIVNRWSGKGSSRTTDDALKLEMTTVEDVAALFLLPARHETVEVESLTTTRALAAVIAATNISATAMRTVYGSMPYRTEGISFRTAKQRCKRDFEVALVQKMIGCAPHLTAQIRTIAFGKSTRSSSIQSTSGSCRARTLRHHSIPYLRRLHAIEQEVN